MARRQRCCGSGRSAMLEPPVVIPGFALAIARPRRTMWQRGLTIGGPDGAQLDNTMLNAGSHREPDRAGGGGQGSVPTPSEPLPLSACIQVRGWVAQTDSRTTTRARPDIGRVARRRAGVIAHAAHHDEQAGWRSYA